MTTEHRRLFTGPFLRHHMCQPRGYREKSFQSSKCEQRIKGLRVEASAEHTSPFCMRTERNTSGSESTSTKKLCEICPKCQVLSQPPYPLSNQALRNSQSHLPKNPMFRIPHATPRRRGKDCQIQGRRGIMCHISKCEQRKQTQDKKISSKSLRGLALDDVHSAQP